MPPFRPIPGDPDGELILDAFDLSDDAEWVLGYDGGEYQSAAVETFKNDGTAYQRVIALEYKGRVNHSDEIRTIRIMMSAEDALGMAEVLEHTAKWLILVQEDS